MKRVLPFIVLAIGLFGAIFLWGRDPGRVAGERQSRGVSAPHASGLLLIDLDQALAVALPKVSASLKPVPFHTPDGREGWVLRFPGIEGLTDSLPIATPAYDNGKLFVGGGFGSSQFYAVDAMTGDVVWHTPTADDGPTAASVDHGNVALNTQSCSLMVMDENNGQTLWKEWLGDPLVSQPTVSKGRVYASYPNTGESPDVSSVFSGEPQTADAISLPGDRRAPQETGGFCLLCADVQHGHHLWKRSLPQEVISAPILVGNRMYLSCYDGTVLCVDAGNGATIWERRLKATSAPVVSGGRIALTVERMRQGVPYEGIVRLDARTGASLDSAPLVLSPAPYLQKGSDGGVSIDPRLQQSLDAREGFSGGLPTTFQVGDNPLFDMDTVTGAWAYQGSRVALSAGRIFDAQGAYVNAVSATNGRVLWRAEAQGEDVASDKQVFSPPALGQRDLYLVSAKGDVVCLDEANGQVVFAYRLGQPIAFQPVLAHGNIYISTSNGLLICLKTGRADADGWYAWGGNAQHNKAG